MFTVCLLVSAHLVSTVCTTDYMLLVIHDCVTNDTSYIIINTQLLKSLVQYSYNTN